MDFLPATLQNEKQICVRYMKYGERINMSLRLRDQVF